MTPSSKVFLPAYAKVLIRIAQGDLGSAGALAKSTEGRLENICYFIQQAAEKTLKALICQRNIPVPLISDLAALMAVLSSAVSIPSGMDRLAGLSEFATVRRYEEGYFTITREEIAESMKLVTELIRWARSQLKETK